MTSPKWLEELEERAKKATPGPWRHNLGNYRALEAPLFGHPDKKWSTIASVYTNTADADIRYMAEVSPDRVLALCKLIREMVDILDIEHTGDGAIIGAVNLYQRGPVIEGEK